MNLDLNEHYSKIIISINEHYYNKLLVQELIQTNIGTFFSGDSNYTQKRNLPGFAYEKHEVSGFKMIIKLTNDKILIVQYNNNYHFFENCPLLSFTYDDLQVMNCFAGEMRHYNRRSVIIKDAYLRENTRFSKGELEKLFYFFLDEINKPISDIIDRIEKQKLANDVKLDELLKLI